MMNFWTDRRRGTPHREQPHGYRTPALPAMHWVRCNASARAKASGVVHTESARGSGPGFDSPPFFNRTAAMQADEQED